jgi:hypothetical protein
MFKGYRLEPIVFLIYSYFDFILMVGVLVVVASSQFPVTCNLGMYLEDPDIV